MSIRATPLSTHIGALVEGLDLRELRPDQAKELRALMVEHHVLFLRGQHLEPDELLAVARRFGEPDTHAFGRHVAERPEVGLLDQTDPEKDGANRWHTDSTFMPEPPTASLLQAVALPEIGGDTSWASTAAAYERLSPPMQRFFEKLEAVHDITGPLERAAAGGHAVGSVDEIAERWPPIRHPVVCTHPESGRKVLYVNSNFTTAIDGVPEAESEALLRFLFAHIRSPELQVRFRWETGSVAIWDNRSTQHYASADYSERRVMHRVTIRGSWAPARAH